MTQKPTQPARLSEPVIMKGAHTVGGRGRGRRMGIPTINIDLAAVPQDLAHGIYACRVSFAGKHFIGALHYGPRPVFRDTVAMEVHVIDEAIAEMPVSVDLEIVGKIRDVADFPDAGALAARIRQDIAETRAILG